MFAENCRYFEQFDAIGNIRRWDILRVSLAQFFSASCSLDFEQVASNGNRKKT
jgi:hypothetical protein